MTCSSATPRQFGAAETKHTFHFHHRAGACLGIDLIGTELGSATEALGQAYLFVLERSRLLGRSAELAVHAVVVTDAAGAPLFELAFSAVVTPQPRTSMATRHSADGQVASLRALTEVKARQA